MRTSSLVLVVLVAVLAGCGNATPSISQQPPTSVVASPTGASVPTATPTPTPSEAPADTPEPTPKLVTIPAGSLKSMAEGPSVAFGSRVFSIERAQPSVFATIIRMRDFTTATSTVVGRIVAGHFLEGLAATADRILYVESWRDHPSPPTNLVPGCVDTGKPLRWRIILVVIASGAQSVIAAGTNLRTAFDGECADVNAPVIAADGDRVGYTLEAASPAHRFANRIVLRSISQGTEIRTFATAGIVQGLALRGQVIAYRDIDALAPSSPSVDPSDARLMVSASDGAAPVVVSDHVRVAGLGDGRIGWISAAAADGSVWTESLGSQVKTQLQVSDLSDFHPDGASDIAVASSTVAWIVQGAGSDSIGTSRLALWTESGVGPALVDRVAQPEFVELSGGWLVWDSSADAPDGEPLGLYGLPVSALVP